MTRRDEKKRSKHSRNGRGTSSSRRHAHGSEDESGSSWDEQGGSESSSEEHHVRRSCSHEHESGSTDDDGEDEDSSQDDDDDLEKARRSSRKTSSRKQVQAQPSQSLAGAKAKAKGITAASASPPKKSLKSSSSSTKKKKNRSAVPPPPHGMLASKGFSGSSSWPWSMCKVHTAWRRDAKVVFGFILVTVIAYEVLMMQLSPDDMFAKRGASMENAVSESVGKVLIEEASATLNPSAVSAGGDIVTSALASSIPGAPTAPVGTPIQNVAPVASREEVAVVENLGASVPPVAALQIKADEVAGEGSSSMPQATRDPTAGSREPVVSSETARESVSEVESENSSDTKSRSGAADTSSLTKDRVHSTRAEEENASGSSVPDEQVPDHSKLQASIELKEERDQRQEKHEVQDSHTGEGKQLSSQDSKNVSESGEPPRKSFLQWFTESADAPPVNSTIICPEATPQMQICKSLNKYIRKYKVRRMADASCEWTESFAPDLIKAYAQEFWGFKYICVFTEQSKMVELRARGKFDGLGDAVEFLTEVWWKPVRMPDGMSIEMWLMYDVLAHASYGRVWSFFSSQLRAGTRFFFFDNYPALPNDPSPDRHFINVRRHPFKFPRAKETVSNVTEPGEDPESISRQLVLYADDQIPVKEK
ncbi:hypothetical protein FVE85_7424 [Porphyridium purpureum]|uniref:Uncharacterized protein n=1 Tax=Porphyridium purpureum TaxID=35688 RepID=A0A5J4Z740_PORPP|nr:hypothetical protein FVE85_7424 [Porphyridium purpureum]|eukprot:POR5006..scf295_1